MLVTLNGLEKTRYKRVHRKGVRPLAYRRVWPGFSDIPAVVGTFELIGVCTEDCLLNMIRKALSAKRVSTGKKSGVGVTTQTNAADQIVIL